MVVVEVALVLLLLLPFPLHTLSLYIYRHRTRRILSIIIIVPDSRHPETHTHNGWKNVNQEEKRSRKKTPRGMRRGRRTLAVGWVGRKLFIVWVVSIIISSSRPRRENFPPKWKG